MVENLGRKLVLIFTLLAVSLGLLLVPEEPFRMGLDLQGGTRLVYKFDWDKARDEGSIGTDENPADVLNQTIDIIAKRVDPNGVLEPIIRSQGSDRIVIELPGTASITGTKAEAPLVTAITGDLANVIDFGAEQLEAAETFPANGGVVEIAGEKITYERRVGAQLQGLQRGHLDTEVTDHDVGAMVTLVSDNAIQNAIENLGELAFMIVAQAGDIDINAEKGRLEAWAAANPQTRLTNFNGVPREQGGPDPRIAWFPQALPDGAVDQGELARTAGFPPMLRPELMAGSPGENWNFTGADLGKVYFTQDSYGYPAVGFEMQSSRKGHFRDFTATNEGRQMAIVLNGEIETAPNITGPLPGGGIIQGRYKAEDVKELITVLRTGSLRIRPILDSEEKVGPTLGADYVRRGLYGGLAAIVSILLFMSLYFRRLGLFSVLALAASMLMLMGGLAFLNATLTLPGIAGIILTVGMAVDANILIFDRIREEFDKGRNIKQAAKNGFDNARSAIIDANVTTFLTAVVLYLVGTGPVRGFAVTLMIGIVASVFAALVLTRVLVHLDLEKKARPFNMGSWLAKADASFMDKSKIAVTGSILAIVAGLVLFSTISKQRKFGIDFLGGATVQVRTEDAQETDAIRSRVAGIPGDVGKSATVAPILSTAASDGYREFRITYKSANPDDADGGDSFVNDIRRELSDLLQEDPIRATVETTAEGITRADLTLHFEESHSAEDLTSRLAAVGLTDIEVSGGTTDSDYAVTATVTGTGDAVSLTRDIEEAFSNRSDSQGNAYRLALPIPDSSVVSAQVVGELRDKAILALLISLFLVVMYIRVRFAEYSYGFAAVTALVHDVLITLGILAVVMTTGIMQVEINLPLIAAFLTIIGYSLNDTIVLFDRVRENLPRVDGGLKRVLNVSINQTLSRTILTSLTTLLAVGLLLGFNFGTGNVLEGFALAMVIGVVVGTYSSIFIAAPMLLWLETRAERQRKSDSGGAAADGRTPVPAG